MVVQSFWAEEYTVDQLLAIAYNPPLFEDCALIVYHDVDKLRGKAPHALLKRYIAHPTPQTTLIITSEQNSLNYAWVRGIAASAKIVCWQPLHGNTIGEVRRVFRKYSLEIDTALVEQFIGALENDSAVIHTSSEHLAQFCAEKGEVSESIIDDFFSFSHTETVFGLINSCLIRESSKALRILHILLEGGDEPTLVVHLFFQALHNLLYLYSLPAPLRDFATAARQRGIVWRSQQQLYKTAYTKFSGDECRRLLGALAHTEALLRQGYSAFSASVLSRFVLSVCEGFAPTYAPRWAQEMSLVPAPANL